MKVIIKNKFLSITGKSTVKDEQGKDLFKVKGSFFNPKKTKKIKDLEGNTLYFVKNKIFTWLNKKVFIYDGEGELLGSIKRFNLSASNRYELEGFADELNIDGEWFDISNPIMKNGVQVGLIERQFISITDTFTLNTDDTENLAFYVALVIAIDNIRDERRNDRKNK